MYKNVASNVGTAGPSIVWLPISDEAVQQLSALEEIRNRERDFVCQKLEMALDKLSRNENVHEPAEERTQEIALPKCRAKEVVSVAGNEGGYNTSRIVVRRVMGPIDHDQRRRDDEPTQHFTFKRHLSSDGCPTHLLNARRDGLTKVASSVSAWLTSPRSSKYY